MSPKMALKMLYISVLLYEKCVNTALKQVMLPESVNIETTL